MEVRCFLGKQKSHIEMSLKSPRNPRPTLGKSVPRVRKLSQTFPFADKDDTVGIRKWCMYMSRRNAVRNTFLSRGRRGGGGEGGRGNPIKIDERNIRGRQNFLRIAPRRIRSRGNYTRRLEFRSLFRGLVNTSLS